MVVLRALGVRRHAAVGIGVGVVVAAATYAYRVGELAGPSLSTHGSPTLFLLRAFVLAASVAALVTVALTVRAAARRAREPE